jgi:hypothetical protein
MVSLPSLRCDFSSAYQEHPESIILEFIPSLAFADFALLVIFIRGPKDKCFGF